MSDEKSRASQDHVHLNEADDIAYWTRELGVTEERLRQVVKDHGASVAAIRAAIG